ncbi:MAG: hypothetical protein AAFW69_03455 [Pseudomonadota bacterium]
MPYVDAFANDVFISYAHDDNIDDIDGQRWVTNFVKLFTAFLRQRLACRNELKIFWDHNNLHANRDLEEALEEEARNSAVFVAISSPAYLTGTYTIRELEAFVGRPGASEGLFGLEILPPNAMEDYHPALNAKIRFPFYRAGGEGGAIQMTLDPRAHRDEYMQAITRFVEQVKIRLLDMKKTGAAPAPAPAQAGFSAPAQAAAPAATPAANGANGTVLLAQTTDDLDWEREQVRSSLAQFDIRVLPEFDYPQGGAEFTEAFAADLGEAELFVQLLGRSAGRRPSDLPEGYLVHQFHAAEGAGKPILSWRHPELDLEQVGNPDHRALLSGETVIASGLESFKSDIQKRLEALRAPPKMPRSALIFVGADRADNDLAERLSMALAKRNYPVALPVYEGTAEDIQRDLEENLIDSDHVVFVHGAAPATWVSGILRRFNKLMAQREAPPSKTALVKAPPPKEDSVRIMLPYLEVIDSSEDFDADRILKEMGLQP